MAYATPQDVKDRWVGTDTLPGDNVLEAWLDDAETLIFAEIPGIIDKVTADPDGTWTRRLIYVEAQLVSQVMRNPDGVRQRAQTAGTFTDSVTYGTETIAQAMSLTPAHRSILTGGGNKHVGIDMTPDLPQHPLDYAWVNGPTPPGER
ncbi:hypothetical protein [Corynebacterium sp. HMSC077B05]|uniref:hypothetical protein n=1 Tax=Corynebacterium sp. HMSC077B05 TaxID=1739252 RepID=UPI0008A2D35A|nr:hypothetical protein [Corynebacterium sp. HMSC077B05]OFL77600.1 hypothetical protein HMPREF2748_03565 [Corynebacterium sp. HMSC077B05]